MISYESLIDEFYSIQKSNGFDDDCFTQVTVVPREIKPFKPIACPVLENHLESVGKKPGIPHLPLLGCICRLECNKDGVRGRSVDSSHDVTVQCMDNGGPDIEYLIEGIASHEMPVIGMYVDKQICPGFPYRIRYLGGTRDVFDDAKPKTLQSIGMGYTHRMTFDSDCLNHNDNVFWSDSHPKGFAFRIQAVNPGDVFVIYDVTSCPIGEAKIESLSAPQEEIDMTVNSGTVCKTVRVWLVCSVVYFQGHHGLVDLHSPTSETIVGEAMVMKSKGEKRAKVLCISNICLSRQEGCTFRKD